MNDKLKNIVTEDQKVNPDCHYSYQNQSSTRNINGQSIHEVMNSINRLCPGQRPVTIYNDSQTDNSNSSNNSWGGNNNSSNKSLSNYIKEQEEVFKEPLKMITGFLQEYNKNPNARGGGSYRPPRNDSSHLDDNDNDFSDSISCNSNNNSNQEHNYTEGNNVLSKSIKGHRAGSD